MLNTALIDAGAIVAILNRSDRHHAEIFQLLKAYEGRLLTIWPVVAEACSLVRARIQRAVAVRGCGPHQSRANRKPAALVIGYRRRQPARLRHRPHFLGIIPRARQEPAQRHYRSVGDQAELGYLLEAVVRGRIQLAVRSWRSAESRSQASQLGKI